MGRKFSGNREGRQLGDQKGERGLMGAAKQEVTSMGGQLFAVRFEAFPVDVSDRLVRQCAA